MGCSGFKSSPAPLNYLKKVLPLTTQCVCVYRSDLIFVITCGCVVCICNDSVDPLKSSLWLSGSPREIRYQKSTKKRNKYFEPEKLVCHVR